MSKIIGVIPPQNYELIRNKVAEIIAIELENQFAMTYDPDFDCNVWLERTTPFDSEEMTPAVINVSFIDGNYQNEDPRDADGVYSYAIDVYARGYTNEDNIGDTRAALIVQKVIGKIRAILMATVYKTVDTGFGIVKNRKVASVQVYDPKRHPQGDDSTTFDQAGRIVFNVTAIESVEVIHPNQISGADTWVRWCCTDKGYVWINDGQTNGSPGDPNVCPPIPPSPPLGPYLRTVAVDGVTITGDGTENNPLKGSAVGSSILLQTDGVDNESQTVLNLKQGNNITITDDGDGGVTIEASGTLGVNSVTATAPIASSGGADPNLSIPQASGSADGYLSNDDWNTFDGKQDSIILTTTGTSGAATLVGSTLNIPQYSGGSGAVDSVNGQTGTVVLDTDDIADTATNRYTNDTDITRLANTSGTNTGDQDLSGLALKTTSISTQSPLSGGGDLSANRTLSIPQANGSTDGFLDSADWVTFNGKFNAPTGTTSEYVRGDGSLATFPTIPSTLGFVPYTGATQDVNLGVNGLTTHDLTVSHPSGSGVAASITKGGAGEALTVVKSSGSGNAASITGGVTLIEELHLTTDLADSYIASAATWNAKFNTPSGTTAEYVRGDGSLATFPALPLVFKNIVDGAASSALLNTFSSSILVPANSVVAGNVIEFKLRGRKTGINAIYTIRLYANTVNSLLGSPILLATFTGSLTQAIGIQLTRTAAVKNVATNTEMLAATTSNAGNDNINSLFSSISVDWTTDKYIIGAVQSNNAADSTLISLISMTII
jgi:hypothetical protein